MPVVVVVVVWTPMMAPMPVKTVALREVARREAVAVAAVAMVVVVAAAATTDRAGFLWATS